MTQKETSDLFVAEVMRLSKKRGLATDALSANRMMAQIFGDALAEVLTQFQQQPDTPQEQSCR
jgi:hypothetical protein